MSVSLNNVNALLNTVNSENDTHRAATNNPHSVTASQVGAYTTSQVNNIVNNIVKYPVWYNASNQSSYTQFQLGVHTYNIPSHIPTNAIELMLKIDSGEAYVYFWNYWDWQLIHTGVNDGNATSYVSLPLRERNYHGTWLSRRQFKFYLVNAPGDDRGAQINVFTRKYSA